MNSVKFLLAAIVIACSNCFCNSARILLLFPMSSPYGIFQVVEELAEQGHEITIVSPIELTKDVRNVREIVLTENMHLNQDGFAPSFEDGVFNRKTTSLFPTKDLLIQGYENLMKNLNFQHFLSKREVDLIIVDADRSDFAYPIVDQFGVPFILYSSASFHSSLPWTFTQMTQTRDCAISLIDWFQSFKSRILDVLSNELVDSVRKIILTRMLEDHTKKDFPNARPIRDIEKDASLFFVNNHLITSGLYPLPPMAVSLGATHTRSANSLPMVFIRIRKRFSTREVYSH